MRVIICGGRDFKDFTKGKLILEQLLMYQAAMGLLTVIEGGAKGADTMACEWTGQHVRCHHIQVNAEWEIHGKAAGHIRNAEMLTYKPDMVIAFPGGRGTENMIKLAKKAEVPVLRIEI